MQEPKGLLLKLAGMSLTSRFSEVWAALATLQTVLNGFSQLVETVKTVPAPHGTRAPR